MFGIKIKENCDFGLWMKFIKCANEHISNFLWDDAHLIMEEWPEDIIDCSFLLPNVIGAHPYLLCYTCYYLSRPWRYIFIRYLIRLRNYFAQILILIWLYIRKLHKCVIEWYEISIIFICICTLFVKCLWMFRLYFVIFHLHFPIMKFFSCS